MARETWVQSQVESYQRLKKWYLMPPCLTLSIVRYGSRVKWSNPGKGVAPFPTLWCSSYRKGTFRVTLDYGHQLYFMFSGLSYAARNFEGWQLHKNAACNPEQVLAAAPHKTPTVRPPAPYHENYSS